MEGFLRYWLGPIVLVLLFALMVFVINFPVITETKEELSDKEMEQEINVRANLVQNFVDSLCDAWNLREDDISPKAEMLPTGVTLVTAIYRNSLIRYYFNWKRNIVHVCVIRKYADKSRTYKKTYWIKHKNLFEKVFAFFEKYQPASEQQLAVPQDKMEKLSTIFETIIEDKVRKVIEEKLAECEDAEPSEKDHAQWSFFLYKRKSYNIIYI